MKTLACALALAGGCAVDARAPVPAVAANDAAIVSVLLTTTGSFGPTAPAPSLSTQAPQQTSLWMGISKIELADQTGAWTTLSTDPMQFDALAFGGGTMLWLADAAVPAGVYRDLRITFDSAMLVVGTTAQPLDMAASVSMIPLDNALGAGGAYDVRLGFDLADSVWSDSNGFAMAPHVDLSAIVPE